MILTSKKYENDCLEKIKDFIGTISSSVDTYHTLLPTSYVVVVCYITQLSLIRHSRFELKWQLFK